MLKALPPEARVAVGTASNPIERTAMSNVDTPERAEPKGEAPAEVRGTLSDAHASQNSGMGRWVAVIAAIAVVVLVVAIAVGALPRLRRSRELNTAATAAASARPRVAVAIARAEKSNDQARASRQRFAAARSGTLRQDNGVREP